MYIGYDIGFCLTSFEDGVYYKSHVYLILIWIQTSEKMWSIQNC